MAVLIEHYAGALPTWLSPEQVRVIPVTDAHADYAQSVVDACAAVGLRATVDSTGEKMGALIRKAKLAKIPYVLVVGDQDVAAGHRGREPAGLGDQARARGPARRLPGGGHRRGRAQGAARGPGAGMTHGVAS